MKRSLCLNFLLAGTLLLSGAVGCKLKPKSPTPIPTRPVGRTGGPEGFGPSGVNDTSRVVVPPPDTGVRTLPRDNPIISDPGGGELTTSLSNMNQNRDFFAAYTVYFDFDRSTIKAGERSKIEEVSRHLLANPTQAVRIEGHCDERGTEGYNVTLGERRALAIREYLVNLGVPADHVDTISFGESRPADPGHDDAAWDKNRRGEFILLTP